MSAHHDQIPVWCVGASCNTTPLVLLEQLSRPVATGPTALSVIPRKLESLFPDQAFVVLATCNRVELYWSHGRFEESDGAACPFPAFTDLELRTLLGIDAEANGIGRPSPIYEFRGEEACRHLYEVASGLDSLVPGEHQILGQVGQAFHTAEREWKMHPRNSASILRELFISAIRAARRVRRETGLARRAVSVSSAAVELARSILGDLASRTVAVLGAGETASLTIQALRAHGARDISVVNRSRERAESVAGKSSAKPFGLDSLDEVARRADILVTATRAEAPLVTDPRAREIIRDRDNRPLVIIDLSLPRNVDSAVADIPGIHLFDLEELRDYCRHSFEYRRSTSGAAVAIILEVLTEFHERFRELSVRPVLGAMWSRANAIREELAEQARAANRDLTPEQWTRVESMLQALMSRMLHDPSERLRTCESAADRAEFARAVGALFGRIPE